MTAFSANMFDEGCAGAELTCLILFHCNDCINSSNSLLTKFVLLSETTTYTLGMLNSANITLNFSTIYSRRCS